MQIKNNDAMFMKLLASQFLIEASKEKLKLYYEKHINVISKISEDEDSFYFMNAYYEDNALELREAAEESIQSAHEANDDYVGYDEE